MSASRVLQPSLSLSLFEVSDNGLQVQAGRSWVKMDILCLIYKR